MKCEECRVEMESKQKQDYIEERWDKLGAVVLHGIETDVCPKCNAIYPLIPKLGPLVALAKQYPGARQFWYDDDGQWVIPDWLKEWRLKTRLQVGDRIAVLLDDGPEEATVVEISTNRYGYDVLMTKPLVSGGGVPDYRTVNHNRCRKVVES